MSTWKIQPFVETGKYVVRRTLPRSGVGRSRHVSLGNKHRLYPSYAAAIAAIAKATGGNDEQA